MKEDDGGITFVNDPQAVHTRLKLMMDRLDNALGGVLLAHPKVK